MFLAVLFTMFMLVVGSGVGSDVVTFPSNNGSGGGENAIVAFPPEVDLPDVNITFPNDLDLPEGNITFPNDLDLPEGNITFPNDFELGG